MNSVAVLSDDRIVSGSKDCTVKVWEAVNNGCDGNDYGCLYTLTEHTEVSDMR